MSTPPVTLMVARRVAEGRYEDLIAWLREGEQLATDFPGYLGSGVLASGAGYAVWYGVVRQISAQQAATLQLSVPVIAALGGVALIGEPVSLRLLIACVVVLGGIALALAPRR